jgi:hypothetical protein
MMKLLSIYFVSVFGVLLLAGLLNLLFLATAGLLDLNLSTIGWAVEAIYCLFFLGLGLLIASSWAEDENL